MPKKKETISKDGQFLSGVNLADGRRFEAGDKIPADIDEKDLEVLAELGVIGTEEEKETE